MRMELNRLTAFAMCVLMAGCSAKDTIIGPNHGSQPNGQYRYMQLTPEVTLAVPESLADSLIVSVDVEDSTAAAVRPMQSTATWLDGWRIRYGWDYDRDFYIDYKTPRSCCYRVYYTLFLSYALQAVNKPLVVYGLSCNADGTITWRIVIGASAIKWMGPVSEWFLMWQAKMQYLG